MDKRKCAMIVKIFMLLIIITAGMGDDTSWQRWVKAVSDCESERNKTYLGTKMYKLLDGTQPYKDHMCATLAVNGSLGIISNDFENCLATKIAYDIQLYPAWIGLRTSNVLSDFSDINQYKWLDCQTFDTNLLTVENNFTNNSSRQCVFIRLIQSNKTGIIRLLWENGDCSTERTPFCQYTNSSLNNATTQPTAADISSTFQTIAIQPEEGGCFINSLTTDEVTQTTSAVTTSKQLHTTAFQSSVAHHMTQISSSTMQTITEPTSSFVPETSSAPLTSTSVCIECRLEELLVSNFSVHGFENELKLIAFNKNAQFPLLTDNSVTLVTATEAVVARECISDAREHEKASLVCLSFSEADNKGPIVTVSSELTVTVKQGMKFIEHPVTVTGDTRVSKLFPSIGRMLSVSAYYAQTQDELQPEFLQWELDFTTDDTISKNADYLVNGNNSGESYFLPSNRVTSIEYECVSIDPSTNLFTAGGCVSQRVGLKAICKCTHTTMFAVMLSVKSVRVPVELKITSLVMQSVSVLFLLVTFCILLRVRKKVRGERIAIQINLVVSLTLFHMVTLLHDAALTNPTACSAVAVLTHFFLLSSVIWMFIEGLLLLLKTSSFAFFSTRRKKMIIASMLVSWGTASLICIFTASIGFATDKYMQITATRNYVSSQSNNVPQIGDSLQYYDTCWISGKSGVRIWAVILPVAIVLILNLLIVIWVAYFVYSKSMEAKKFKPTEQSENGYAIDSESLKSVMAALKAVGLLLPVLGIPWILAFCTNFNDVGTSTAFAYANAICNGLQGICLFVVYCVIGREVRVAASKSLSSIVSTLGNVSYSIEKLRKKSVGNLYDSSSMTTKSSTLPRSLLRK